MNPPPEQPKAVNTVISFDSFNPQTACFLFTGLPTELRLEIYKFIFAEYDDLNHPYSKNDAYYRPTHRYARRIHTAFLQTCRHAYIETHLLPLSLNNHTFFFYREPPDREFRTDVAGFFKSLTPTQAAAVHHVHLYTQQYWLESFRWQSHTWPSLTNICTPRTLTITIRHTDWWYWEYDRRLGIDPRRFGRVYNYDMVSPDPCTIYRGGWGGFFFYCMPSLEEVVIELETEQRKKDELDYIVNHHSQGWCFPAHDGRLFVKDNASTKRYTWIGSTKFRPTNIFPSNSVPNTPAASADTTPQSTTKLAPDEMIMYVVVMKWTPQTLPSEEMGAVDSKCV